MANKNSIETAIKLIADGRLSREVAKELFPGVEFDENEITKGEIIAFLKKEYKGRWVQWIEENYTKRPIGVEIIDDDTLRLTDEYCSFILHRPAKKEMKWDDAMSWAKGNGWELPDRHQGLTIARFKDEVCKHFGIKPSYFWTKEPSSSDNSWCVYMGNGFVNYDNRTSDGSVLAVSAFTYIY